MIIGNGIYEHTYVNHRFTIHTNNGSQESNQLYYYHLNINDINIAFNIRMFPL